MTLHQIASSIMNMVTHYEGVTNVSLEYEQIIEEVNTLRSRLISEADRTGSFRKPYNGFTQRIDYVRVNKSQNGNIYYAEIPKLYIHLDGTPACTYIGSTNRVKKYNLGGVIDTDEGTQPWRLLTGQHYMYAEHDMFLQSMPIAIYEEGVIRFPKNYSDYITIVGVFERPNEVETYDEENDIYPVPAGMIDVIIGKTTNSIINYLMRAFVQPNTQSNLQPHQVYQTNPPDKK